MTHLVAENLDEQKTLASIRKAIEQPPVNSRVFWITPMIAEELLREFNIDNRSKKPRKIAIYADDMAAHRWPLTGDTVKFSDAHRLRDGQNRLSACVRCGVAFQTHIVFGIPDSAFDRLDQGQNRNGADVLFMAGYKNTTPLSGAVRWVHLIDEGRAKQRDTYEPPDILRLLQERYSQLPDFIQQGRSIYENAGQPQAVATAILYLLHRANPTKAIDFAAAWETAKWDGKFKPIGLMQTRLGDIRAKTSGRVHDVVRAALIIKAWNLFVSGRKGRKLDMNWEMSEPFPNIAS